MLQYICAKLKQLDVWENHKYLRDELILSIPQRGGWDYFKPVNWYLFGLN